MAKIEVCLSPALLNTYSLDNKIVIVTDVLRATTTMLAALDSGVKSIIPVASQKEARRYIGQAGVLVAGERDGKKVDGFDLGNSPLGMIHNKEELQGKILVMTTTNGTKAIDAARPSKKIYIGALTNLNALADHLRSGQEDLLVLCAGWKNRVNMEDSLFAGGLCDRLNDAYQIYGDAAIMTMQLFTANKPHLLDSIKQATHYQRLKNHGIEEDINYCMTLDKTDSVAYLDNDVIVKI